MLLLDIAVMSQVAPQAIFFVIQCVGGVGGWGRGLIGCFAVVWCLWFVCCSGSSCASEDLFWKHTTICTHYKKMVCLQRALFLYLALVLNCCPSFLYKCFQTYFASLSPFVAVFDCQLPISNSGNILTIFLVQKAIFFQLPKGPQRVILDLLIQRTSVYVYVAMTMTQYSLSEGLFQNQSALHFVFLL